MDDPTAEVFPASGQASFYTKGRRGRLPGGPKVPGSGRRKGTMTKAELMRAFINRRGKPIEVLCAIAAGRGIPTGGRDESGRQVLELPSLDQRLAAARILLNKVLGDVRPVEVDDLPAPGDPNAPDPDRLEVARRIAWLLGDAARQLDDQQHPTEG